MKSPTIETLNQGFQTLPNFLTTEELSQLLAVSCSQIEKARSNRTEPKIPYVKVGKSVRYSAQAVSDWLDAHTVRE